MNSEVKQRIEQLNNGEIPKGYKKTDFGVFPSDWVTDKTLGDLFDFYGGLSKSRDELGEEGYAYLHYGDLHRGSFNTVSIDQYEHLPKCDISLTGKEKCLMKDGDVAFLDASEDLEGTSRAVLIDNPENKPFIAGLHIIYGKAKNDSLSKWFKQYITSSNSVKKQFQRLAVGFKVYGVNRDTIPRIRLAYPSSNKEQSKIAEILMKWDEAIELYDKQIDALTRYKAVCLRKMFPAKGQNVPEWRFQGFTDAWEQRKLSDVTSIITKGTTPLDKTGAGEINFIKIENLDSNSGEILSCAKITKEEHEGYLKRSQLKKDDILFSIAGTLGRVGVVKSSILPANTNQALSIIRLKEGNLGYISTALKGKVVADFIRCNPTIGAQPNLSLEQVGNLAIPYPEIHEQIAVGDFFGKVDNLITLHQRKKEAITNQRKTLQQYLLNGIVRVKNE